MKHADELALVKRLVMLSMNGESLPDGWVLERRSLHREEDEFTVWFSRVVRNGDDNRARTIQASFWTTDLRGMRYEVTYT